VGSRASLDLKFFVVIYIADLPKDYHLVETHAVDGEAWELLTPRAMLAGM